MSGIELRKQGIIRVGNEAENNRKSRIGRPLQYMDGANLHGHSRDLTHLSR